MTKTPEESERRTEVRSLYADHIGYALDLLWRSVDLARDDVNAASLLESRRCATSAVIHGVCAVEALLNFVCYRRFYVQASPKFIPCERRDILLHTMLKHWRRLTTVDKFNLILSVESSSEVPGHLQCRMAEVNNLRNWLVHGMAYHSTLQVIAASHHPPKYVVLDDEPSQNWEQKFPVCHFNEPLALTYHDAQTALRVVLEVLLLLSQQTEEPWYFMTCYPELCAHGLNGKLPMEFNPLLRIEETEQPTTRFE